MIISPPNQYSAWQNSFCPNSVIFRFAVSHHLHENLSLSCTLVDFFAFSPNCFIVPPAKPASHEIWCILNDRIPQIQLSADARARKQFAPICQIPFAYHFFRGHRKLLMDQFRKWYDKKKALVQTSTAWPRSWRGKKNLCIIPHCLSLSLSLPFSRRKIYIKRIDFPPTTSPTLPPLKPTASILSQPKALCLLYPLWIWLMFLIKISIDV